MIGGRDSYNVVEKKDGVTPPLASYERNEDEAEATERTRRQQSFDNAMLAKIMMTQVTWLRRIFWLMMILWVILPVLATILWALSY